MGNKTVVYNGSIYEIGKPYLFGNAANRWEYGILIGIGPRFKNPFYTKFQQWPFIKEIHYTNKGTITAVPLELVNGNAYMFWHHVYQKLIVGVYNDGTGEFITNHSSISTINCTDIREMTVKETK
tara:strand:+ start:490 stop:864 length:375 start_codon:yes stop_codon:yes gene_type:complete